MKMKTRIITAGALILLSVGALTAAISGEKGETAPAPTETVQATAAEFYLRDCDGYIAIFRGASSEPVDVTDIETATLNDTDARLLRQGIPADSRSELLLLLEDLGS